MVAISDLFAFPHSNLTYRVCIYNNCHLPDKLYYVEDTYLYSAYTKKDKVQKKQIPTRGEKFASETCFRIITI